MCRYQWGKLNVVLCLAGYCLIVCECNLLLYIGVYHFNVQCESSMLLDCFIVAFYKTTAKM